MSKYDSFDKQGSALSIEMFLSQGETALWKGKPDKHAYIVNKIFAMLPIVLIWLGFDLFFIITFLGATGGANKAMLFLVPFFAIHLFPVWRWLSGILTAGKQWESTEYMVTDRRILIKNGFLTKNLVNLSYQELKGVTLKMGMVDRMLHVGDIYLMSTHGTSITILDVKNPEELANRLQKIIFDIQSDIAYPNALRPNENAGYRTGYTGGM